jgi:hypothetical protein
LTTAILLLSGIATDGETHGGADFGQSDVAQSRYAPSEALLRDGDHVVQVHCARLLHAVRFIEHDLRWHASNRGRDGRDSHRRQVRHGAFPRQDDDWTLFVGRSKPVKANVASRYSGHAASASQADASCGFLK